MIAITTSWGIYQLKNIKIKIIILSGVIIFSAIQFYRLTFKNKENSSAILFSPGTDYGDFKHKKDYYGIKESMELISRIPVFKKYNWAVYKEIK